MTNNRAVLVVSHFERHDVDKAVELLHSYGINVVNELPAEEEQAHVELVLSLGGDGTFLRATEIARKANLPVLGLSLIHI